MNHTKGPWGFDGHGINSPEGERICKVAHSEPYDYPNGKAVRNERFDADSKLIASAPELLQLVKQLTETLEGEGLDKLHVVDDANELLKKLEAQ
jgi:hypothetical protein